jgi:hypothetical protein
VGALNQAAEAYPLIFGIITLLLSDPVDSVYDFTCDDYTAASEAGIDRQILSPIFRNGNSVYVWDFQDDLFRSLYKKRGECEPKHGHIKEVVKFDIRRIRSESRGLYSLLNFVAYQFFVLTELQNKLKSRNSFGRFF